MTDEFYSRYRRTDLQCGALRIHAESRVTASRPPRRWGGLFRMLVILLTITLCPVNDVRRAMLSDWIVPESQASSTGPHQSGMDLPTGLRLPVHWRSIT